MAQIHELIGKAMADVGAIGKDSFNSQQKFKYRGIDAVMNALNPVMQKHGLFVTPEVINQVREERQTNNGGRLLYSILTMKYTMYAPDGSSVSATVIGEGMDSGDKASNKAMSVAFKYAMFQLFCIPTEEMIDPDSETPPESKPEQKQQAHEPAKVTATPVQQSVNSPKTRDDYVQLLKQNAYYIYNDQAMEKLNGILANIGATLETLTGSQYKEVCKVMNSELARKGAA